MKPEKFTKLIEEIDVFYGRLVFSGQRALFLEDIINEFIARGYKEKHIKKAYKESYGEDQGW